MTDTPYTDKHASPWVPEPNTDWVPAYMVRELEREFNAAKSEVERLKEQLESTKLLAVKFWKVLEENGFKIELPK